MRAEIEVQPPGKYSRIVVDGRDLSGGVRGFIMRGAVGEFPTLELELVVVDATNLSGEVQVIVPDGTREALIALGWTPPAEGLP